MTKIIYRKNSLYSSVTCLALCRNVSAGLGASCIWNQMKGEPANKFEKRNNAANANPCSHSGVKITLLIIQLQARVHSRFTSPPYPAPGISVCVHKYWAVRWKRAPLHSGMGVPTLNAWVTDYFLTSWTSTLWKEEPKPPSEEAKLETRALRNDTKIVDCCIKDLTSAQCAQLLALTFQAFFTPPPRNSVYAVVVWDKEYTAILVCGNKWRLLGFHRGRSPVCNSRVKRQAWKSCKESSSCVLKPGSAFAKVHFCISEHTNPSACSNSLQLSHRQLHDNSPAAALFDLQCFP